MTTLPSCVVGCALALGAFAVTPCRAQDVQSMQRRPAPVADSVTAWPWRDRVSIVARYGAFRPAGRSELYSLLDGALDPGAAAIRPTLAGGEVQLRVSSRWSALLGLESGSSTVASFSRVQPGPGSGDVRQQTRLALTAPYVGAEWQVLRWRVPGLDASADRARVVLEAGGGITGYRLRQWGRFVDVQREIEYPADFRSAGHGAFGYVGAGIDVPVRSWLALQGDVRRRTGSARMNADYATFDRLDLGGTSVSAGVLLRPATLLRRK